MAGSSSRGKSPGLGYQGPGTGTKTDYSSRARNSYDTEISRNQSMNQIAPKGDRLDRNTTVINRVPGMPYGNPFARQIPRTYVPTAAKPPAKKPPAAAKPPAKKPPAAAKPTTRGPAAPTRTAQPSRMAVNPRTGNTTGFTTGTRTGTSASKPGVAGKTTQSAYSRQMSNAARNQPAGPMGGGGGGRGGSMGSSGSSSRSAGTSRTGGTRTNEPAGPRRG